MKLPGIFWTWLVIFCWCFIGNFDATVALVERPNIQDGGPHVFKYDRDQLMKIASSAEVLSFPKLNIPKDCAKRRHRARGCRGGVRQRARRRGNRPFVPSVTFGNVRSLVNKIDEFCGNCRYLCEYREACLLGITETWLNPTIPDSVMDVNGFQLVRCDRTDESGKSRGGGVAWYINESWCSNITIKDSICSNNIELLSISLRPFYLPREFSNVFATVFYIPPDADRNIAVNALCENVNNLISSKPDALHILCGDANHCVQDLINTLHGYQQCVTCSTRGSNMLDPFFCNIKDSYKCCKLPPVMSGDHNMIQMVPRYKPKYKTVKPTMISKVCMDKEAVDTLNTCFDLTLWDMFVEDCAGDVNELTTLVTSYISFCADMHLPTKSIKIYANNRPWMTSELRKEIVDKHKAFGKDDYKEKQKTLNRQLKAAKTKYKNKVEGLFRSHDVREAWRGLRVLTGMEQRQKDPAILQEPGSADRLNRFYARFDCKDFNSELGECRSRLIEAPPGDICGVTVDAVNKVLGNIKARKATGPDGISGKLIKSCRKSLLNIIHVIFELSLSTSTYPSIWKVGEIVPVSKKPLPKCDNDLRPVTLTAILSKCLERVGLDQLLPFVKDSMDPLQFAYIKGRSTEDAICTVMHKITQHLDERTSNTVRVLYIDFSSAFNTIVPHIMVNKLAELNIPEYLQLWVLDYLTQRPQYVRTRSETSDNITLNVGAPQGCVLSPVLFVLYTNNMTWNSGNTIVVKYADDTMIVGLVKNDDDSDYFKCIDFVSNWCKENYLDINVSKTKEVVYDYRKTEVDRSPVVIDGKDVDAVEEYKYLGLVMDNSLTFSGHVEQQIKKVNRRLYFTRSLIRLGVNNDIVRMFFNMVIPPVLMYACCAFYGYVTQKLQDAMNKPKRYCERLLRRNVTLDENDSLYRNRMSAMGTKIIKDSNHPLHNHFILMSTGRRWRTPYSRTNRFKNSFVPSCIRLMNE